MPQSEDLKGALLNVLLVLKAQEERSLRMQASLDAVVAFLQGSYIGRFQDIHARLSRDCEQQIREQPPQTLQTISYMLEAIQKNQADWTS
jgi:phosphoserine phosphatase